MRPLSGPKKESVYEILKHFADSGFTWLIQVVQWEWHTSYAYDLGVTGPEPPSKRLPRSCSLKTTIIRSLRLLSSRASCCAAHLGVQVLPEVFQRLLPVPLMGGDLQEYALKQLVQLHRRHLQVCPVCLDRQGVLVSFLGRGGSAQQDYWGGRPLIPGVSFSS